MLLKVVRVHVAVRLRGGHRIESRIWVAFLGSPCAFTCVALLCLPIWYSTCAVGTAHGTCSTRQSWYAVNVRLGAICTARSLHARL